MLLDSLLSTGAVRGLRKKKVAAQLAGVSEGNEELAVLGAEAPTVCPVTRLPLTRPVRNRLCNHVYSYDGAQVLLHSRKPLYAPPPTTYTRLCTPFANTPYYFMEFMFSMFFHIFLLPFNGHSMCTRRCPVIGCNNRARLLDEHLEDIKLESETNSQETTS